MKRKFISIFILLSFFTFQSLSQNFIKETSKNYNQLIGELQSLLITPQIENVDNLLKYAKALDNQRNQFKNIETNTFEDFMNKVYSCYINFAKGIATRNVRNFNSSIGLIDKLSKHPKINNDYLFKLYLLKLFNIYYKIKLTDEPDVNNFFKTIKTLNTIQPNENNLMDIKEKLSLYAYAGAREFIIYAINNNDDKLIEDVNKKLKSYTLKNDEISKYYNLSFKFIDLIIKLKKNLGVGYCGVEAGINFKELIDPLKGEFDIVLDKIKDEDMKDQLLVERCFLDIIYSALYDQPINVNKINLYINTIKTENLKKEINLLINLTNFFINLKSDTNPDFRDLNGVKYLFWDGFFNFFTFLTTDGNNKNALKYSITKFEDLSNNKNFTGMFSVQAKFYSALTKALNKEKFNIKLADEEVELLTDFQKNYYYALKGIGTLDRLSSNHMIKQFVANPLQYMSLLLPNQVEQMLNFFKINLFNNFQGKDDEKIKQVFALLNLLYLREQQMEGFLASYAFISNFKGENKYKCNVLFGYSAFLLSGKFGKIYGVDKNFTIPTIPEPISYLLKNPVPDNNDYYADYKFVLMKLYQLQGKNDDAIKIGEELCSKIGDIRGCYNLATLYEIKNDKASQKKCFDRIVTISESDKNYGCDVKVYYEKAKKYGGQFNQSYNIEKNFDNIGLNVADLQYFYSFAIPNSYVADYLILTSGFIPDLFFYKLPFATFSSMVTITFNLNVSLPEWQLKVYEFPSMNLKSEKSCKSLSEKIDLMAGQNYLIKIQNNSDYYNFGNIYKFTNNATININLIKKSKLSLSNTYSNNNNLPLLLAVEKDKLAILYLNPKERNNRYVLTYGNKEIKISGKILFDPKLIFILNQNIYIYDKAKVKFIAFNSDLDILKEDKLLTDLNNLDLGNMVSISNNKKNIVLISSSGRVLYIDKKSMTIEQSMLKVSDFLSAKVFDNFAYLVKDNLKLYFISPLDSKNEIEFSGVETTFIPLSFDIDKASFIYVFSPKNNSILKFNSIGELVDKYDLKNIKGKNCRLVIKTFKNSEKLFLLTNDNILEYNFK